MIRPPIIEPDLGRFEHEYRKIFLKGDALQAILIIGLSNATSLAFIRSDFRSLGWTVEFQQFLAARLIVFLISLLAIYILAISPNPRSHDLAVTSYMIAGAFINIFINSMVKADYVAYIGVAIVLLNIYYFALYVPFGVRLSISILFSAAVVYQGLSFPFSHEAKTVIVGMHVVTNLIGAFISARLYTHRRLSFQAQVEERELKQELEGLARLDSLTNILNRRAFSESAEMEFHRAKRYERSLSLILVDIDHLKRINDTHGHLAGDEAIRFCSAAMNSDIRDQDFLGRLGGDEFGILLPETPLTEAVKAAKRIQGYCKRDHALPNGKLVRLSVSLGVAELAKNDENFDDLFMRADRMLYLAKNKGRSRLVYEG